MTDMQTDHKKVKQLRKYTITTQEINPKSLRKYLQKVNIFKFTLKDKKQPERDEKDTQTDHKEMQTF